MKTLVIAFLALFASSSAFASGKITASPKLFMDSQKVGGTIGLGVYEKLAKALAINAWGGFGIHPYNTHSVKWGHLNADLEFYTGKWTFGAGAGLTTIRDYSGVDDNVHVKMGYQLW